MLSAALVAVMMAAVPALALPEPVYDPTPEEEALFASIMERLESNGSAMPIAVDETLASFRKPLRKTFDCPEGSFVRSIDLSVSTKHVRWNTKVAVERSLGTYKWNLDLVTYGDTAKITANNWLMIDPRPAARRESEQLSGSTTNEALLYHELLHGQLVITEMDSAEWQARACSRFGAAKVSRDYHETIDPAVGHYLRAVSSEDADTSASSSY